MAKNPIVTIEMENGGKIVAELVPRGCARVRAQLHRSGKQGLL